MTVMFARKYFWLSLIFISPLLSLIINDIFGLYIAMSPTRLATLPIVEISVTCVIVAIVIFGRVAAEMYLSSLLFTVITLLTIILSSISTGEQFPWVLIPVINGYFICSLLLTYYSLEDILYSAFKLHLSIFIILFSYSLLKSNLSIQEARGGLNIYSFASIFVSFLFAMHKKNYEQGRLIIITFFMSILSATRLSSILLLILIFRRYPVKTFSLIAVVFSIVFSKVDLSNLYFIQRFMHGSFLDIIVASRFTIWEESYSIFESSNFLGVGLNNYYLFSSTGLDSAHNLFLTLLTELGLVGGSLVSVFFVSLLLKVYPAFTIISMLCFAMISGFTFLQVLGMTSAFNFLFLQLLVQYNIANFHKQKREV